MKIGYFAFSESLETFDAGFVHTRNIVKNLAKLGVEVMLFIRVSRIPEKEDFEIIPVTLPTASSIFRANPINYIKSYSEIKEKTKDLEIIHERFHINPVDLLFIKDKRYILEVNDPGIETWSGLRKFFYSPLVKLKFDRCDAIITQTETLKGILERHCEKPIYVVPNGVDLEKFNPNVKSDVREKYDIGEDEILVTFVGAFREWHGVQDIVKIADRIKRKNVKFLLIGSGAVYDKIKEKCRNRENILLTGAQKHENIPKFLATSDILIAPFNISKFEQLEKFGFWWCPVKLFEYMASGKAIVSYDFEEVRKIVKDAGLLAKPGDLEDFIQKLSLLIEDENLREKLGSDARKIAEEYGWNKRAKKVAKIYEKVL